MREEGVCGYTENDKESTQQDRLHNSAHRTTDQGMLTSQQSFFSQFFNEALAPPMIRALTRSRCPLWGGGEQMRHGQHVSMNKMQSIK